MNTSYLSVCLHVDGFRWNLVLGFYTKYCRKN